MRPHPRPLTPNAGCETGPVRRALHAVLVVALGAAFLVWVLAGPTPVITDAARPANVPDIDFTWHVVSMPGGASSVVGVVRAPDGAGRDRAGRFGDDLFPDEFLR